MKVHPEYELCAAHSQQTYRANAGRNNLLHLAKYDCK